MKNKRYICVFDFETDGTDPEICSPVQVAAEILDPKSLKSLAQFESPMKPDNIEDENYVQDHLSTIEWHAKLNGMTVEEIVESWTMAPNTKQVWSDFYDFISAYHMKQRYISSFTAPIPAGYNIVNFDIPIANRLAYQYGFVDNKGQSKIFSRVNKFDVYDMVFTWFENLDEPDKLNMDSMRDFLGMSSENAHDAMQDVKDTSAILRRFLTFQRSLGSVEKFKGAFNGRK